MVADILNQKPQLFTGVFCNTPFTDILRFQKITLDTWRLLSTATVKKRAELSILLKYSLLHNVKAQKYPVLSNTCDYWGDLYYKVVPFHSYKHLTELQYNVGKIMGQNPLILRDKMHRMMQEDRYQRLLRNRLINCYIFIAEIKKKLQKRNG